jgi:hypothetical protein
MRGLIGCFAVLGIVAMVIGLIGSLFLRGASIEERLIFAVCLAAVIFVAVLMLNARDRLRYLSNLRTIRRILLARDDVSEADFASCFPDTDPILLGQLRRAMSEFFSVPATKIHAADKFVLNSCVDLEPTFHSFLIAHIASERKLSPQWFIFHSASLADFGTFVKEIQRVLDGLDSSHGKPPNEVS